MIANKINNGISTFSTTVVIVVTVMNNPTIAAMTTTAIKNATTIL